MPRQVLATVCVSGREGNQRLRVLGAQGPVLGFAGCTYQMSQVGTVDPSSFGPFTARTQPQGIEHPQTGSSQLIVVVLSWRHGLTGQQGREAHHYLATHFRPEHWPLLDAPARRGEVTVIDV